ncbi:MAG: PPE domain-containing protein, partial [Mycobacterium sp.]|nr:PPE domain-containing protein [Mycobacterium sp.]
RARLLALIATNFFGQNIAAIMETQAQYLEMWAQDAAAMYGYAGSSAVATDLTPFDPPPRTTSSQGAASQAAAVAQAVHTAAGSPAQGLPHTLSAVPSLLNSLATPTATPAQGSPTSALSAIDKFITGPFAPESLFGFPGTPELLGAQSYLVSQGGVNVQMTGAKLATLPATTAGGVVDGIGPGARTVGFGGTGMSVGVGRGGLVGGLSVPQGWASAAPEIKTIAAMLPESSLNAAPAALAGESPGGLYGSMALSSLAGRAAGGTGAATASASSAGVGGAGAVEATTANIFVIPEFDE